MYNKLVNEKRIIANIPIDEIDPYEDYPFIIDERKMLVENHALIRFFSVRRDRELDPYWNKESEWD